MQSQVIEFAISWAEEIVLVRNSVEGNNSKMLYVLAASFQSFRQDLAAVEESCADRIPNGG